MTQLTIMELFDKMENKESNNKMEETIKDEMITENVSTSVIKEEIYDPNEIVEVKYGNGEIYKTWITKSIIPLIKKFTKEKCPNSFVVRELNNIDITLFDNELNCIIPIEMQKSLINGENRFNHAQFEKDIRPQLESNIENYGKCWLFMDSEYLRFLQYGDVGKSISIDMTWLVRLMKKNTLKVFSIKYDGVVRELTTKDFDFLQTLYNDDEKELNRNKLKIYRNVVRGYNYTQEEITQFENNFDNRLNKKEKIGNADFFIKSGNEKCKLYGYIIQSIGNLNAINSLLDMNISKPSDKNFSIFLRIFEIVGNYASGTRGNHIRFTDKFNVCKYFPGYLRQEKHWLTYKGNEMDGKTFLNMCCGMYKNASTIFDY